MKQLHYTYNQQDNTITLIHKTGTSTTIPIGHDLLKKLNYYAQTIPNNKEIEELTAINEDLYKRYHYCSVSKINTANRAHNINNILKLEKRRIEIHNNLTTPCKTPQLTQTNATTKELSELSTTLQSLNSQDS